MYGIPATPAPVVDGMSRGGAAEIAGMQVGDRIVSFNGSENPKWETIRGDGLLSPGQPLPIVVERNGQRLALTITPTAHVEDGETSRAFSISFLTTETFPLLCGMWSPARQQLRRGCNVAIGSWRLVVNLSAVQNR